MNKLRHFNKNVTGRDFVVGDIHGCFSLLENKLHDIGFNIKNDRLFSVGDLVDRGAKSEESIKWLLYPWFHAVRGNHEQMVIDAAEGWFDRSNYISNGGKWFLDLTKEERAKYAEDFSKLPIAIEIDTDVGLIGIVHAECPTNKWADITVASPQLIIWSRDRINSNNQSIIEGIHKLYVGHTPVKENIILGNTHYIDTGAFYTGKLTILEL